MPVAAPVPRLLPRSTYNASMDLKLHLLIRMTLLGLLCWLGTSIYVVARSGQQANRQLVAAADQLQLMISADVARRLASSDADARYPELSWAGAHFPEPLCLRYRAWDGSTSDQHCNRTAVPGTRPSLVRLLFAWSPGAVVQRRQIAVFARPVGELEVVLDREGLIDQQWRSVRDLLGLSALTLLALDLLTFLLIDRALRPAGAIVGALERLGECPATPRLPAYRPREFNLIAGGINQLAERLTQTSAARAALTVRLIRLQESERRELAHELHEQFGQCVSALSAVSTSLRQSIMDRQVLTEADVAPLELGVEHMLSSLQGLLKRLSRPPLEQQGLLSAVTDLVALWQIRSGGSPNIVLDSGPGTDQVPNDERALCVYRVVQECLSNIVRHAPESRGAKVCIRHDTQQLSVRVSNTHAGAVLPRAPSTGMGLALLGEWVHSLQGSWLVHESTEEFIVQAMLPL
jgi:two-component system, NarL family, sensor histidine kinase UhpB